MSPTRETNGGENLVMEDMEKAEVFHTFFFLFSSSLFFQYSQVKPGPRPLCVAALTGKELGDQTFGKQQIRGHLEKLDVRESVSLAGCVTMGLLLY